MSQQRVIPAVMAGLASVKESRGKKRTALPQERVIRREPVPPPRREVKERGKETFEEVPEPAGLS